MPLKVMLCCNDYRNGFFTGHLDGVDIDIQGDDLELRPTVLPVRLTLQHKSEPMRGAKAYEGTETIRIGRLSLPCLQYRTWVGNWCWDCVWLRAIHARRLLNYLLTLKSDWRAESGPSELFDAINERRVVTSAEWKSAFQPEPTGGPHAD